MMRALSYILLYGFLATCSLATGQEITIQNNTKSDSVAYNGQHHELVREWLRLIHGLQNNPSQYFERHTATTLTPEQYKKTWYYLGRGFFLRGEYPAASAALAHIKGKLPEEIKQDYPLLIAQILIVQGQFERAAAILDPITNQKTGVPYAQFNLGIALLKSGRQSRGIEVLEVLGSSPADTPEAQALRDQANIALGYMYLDKGQAQKAKQALKRTSLNGPNANKALLALGWAEWQSKNPRLAQAAWVELLKGDMASPITQEALSGVPQALWRLESHTQARKKFNEAIAAYKAQLSLLDDVIDQVRTTTWLTDAFNETGPDEFNLKNIWMKLDDTPLSPFLREILTSQPLQTALQKHLALQRLESQLATPSRLYGLLGIRIDQSYREAVNALNKDLQLLKQQLPTQKTSQLEYLTTLVTESLERQRKQLTVYLVSTQYALAQLLDELASKEP